MIVALFNVYLVILFLLVKLKIVRFTLFWKISRSASLTTIRLSTTSFQKCRSCSDRTWRRMEREGQRRRKTSVRKNDGGSFARSAVALLAGCRSISRHVRFWHKADIQRLSSNVRFWG
jgi:hypothetical protein